MPTPVRTPAAEALTDLVFDTFRVHGRLIAFGDELVRRHGLTSARWQVLGTIGLAGQDLTVPMIARHLGLSRQAVQRVANELARDGFVKFAVNPHHKRAKLVRHTKKGRAAYVAADRDWTEWANAVAKRLDRRAIEASRAVLQSLDAVCGDYLAAARPAA